ncbi:MAG: DJ-1/PfpI family protein [Rufibacter sp.]
MTVAIIAFDDFTDIDVFFLWDLLNRVNQPTWQVKILADKPEVISATGIKLTVHGQLEEAATADAVLFSSGIGTRVKMNDTTFLSRLTLSPKSQLIGSMCSGSLLLASLGLLDNLKATTYPTSKTLLESLGVEVVEEAFVQQGNMATAAGCLAAQYLVGWVIEALIGPEEREAVLRQVQPVGEGMFFEKAAATPV